MERVDTMVRPMPGTGFRRALGVFALMVLAAWAATVLRPQHMLANSRPAIDPERAVPDAFGEWGLDRTTVPVLPSPGTKETLDKTYDQILSRTYVHASSGKRMMLSIAYGDNQNQESRAHRQEVCYAAQGFRISRLHPADVNINRHVVSATRLVAEMGGCTEPVTYWFTMGDSVVRSILDRELVHLKYAVLGFIPDGYLFRVSSVSNDPDTAFEEQRLFVQELVMAMSQDLATVLSGSKR